jgi:arsenite methyltransferase
MKETEVIKAVRERYGSVARQGGSCCSANTEQASSCCGTAATAQEASKQIGYSEAEIASAPEGANLGLGCGNPLALASLKPGETVLDLGSGGGFDCFLAAGQVGKTGHVIGVDMTPDMIDRARDNIQKSGYSNVEFRLGEIEHLPVADSSVDAIISNCVINLSQHKDRVFAESFRVLKPGGRLMVSDMVLLSPLPAEYKTSLDAYVSCVAGASLKGDYLEYIRQAGFKDITVASEDHMPVEIMMGDPNIQALITKVKPNQDELLRVADTVVSVKVSAVKPTSRK